MLRKLQVVRHFVLNEFFLIVRVKIAKIIRLKAIPYGVQIIITNAPKRTIR